MRGSKILAHLACLTLCATLFPGVALANPSPGELCDAAAQAAAAESGVPLDILLAITRAETGRRYHGRLSPWPWAINDDGQGFWFETAEEAWQAAKDRLAAGDGNFDIGCFQINTHWHGDVFGSVEDMFDPLTNARYAAQFLTRLWQESGDWDQAIAAYHSRTADLAGPYLTRVTELRGLAPLQATTAVETARAAPQHPNLFPLLKSGGQGAPGSLVPLQAGLGPLFEDRG